MNTNKYSTFWPRLFAAIIDGIVFIVLGMVIAIIPMENNKNGFIFAQLLYTLIPLTYFVIGHGKYGYTIGKKAMKLKVLRLDERNLIGYKWAFLRESVWVFLNIAVIVYLVVDSWGRKTIEVRTLEALEGIVAYSSIAWFAIELITMQLNIKRRALHDFIAKSIVIKTDVKQT